MPENKNRVKKKQVHNVNKVNKVNKALNLNKVIEVMLEMNSNVIIHRLLDTEGDIEPFMLNKYESVDQDNKKISRKLK